MPVETSRELLAVDLKSYGEDDLAARIEGLADSDLRRVFERADHYLYGDRYATASGASPLIAWTLAMAAVEVIEGAARPLRRKRRRLKGIWQGDGAVDRSAAASEPPPGRSRDLRPRHPGLTDAVRTALHKRLETLGFSALRRDRRYLSGASSDETRGWISVPTAAFGGIAVHVNPMIGVRHEQTENIAADLGDGDRRSPTVLRALFELLPGGGYRAWEFTPDNIEAVVEDLTMTVELFGQPFIDRLHTLEEIETALRDWAFIDTRRSRLPIIAGLRAGPAGATRALDAELALLDGPARDEYATFAKRLLDHLAA